METFGERVRDARKARKLTQKQLSAAVNMSQGNLSDIETGNVPSSTYTPALADALGVSAIWLASGKGSRDAGRTNSPGEPVKNTTDLRRSANSQKETDAPDSNPAPTITYEMIRKVVAGTLQGFGLSYERLVPDDTAAQQRIEAALRLAAAPQADIKVLEEGAPIVERRREDRRKAQSWKTHTSAPAAPKEEKRRQRGA